MIKYWERDPGMSPNSATYLFFDNGQVRDLYICELWCLLNTKNKPDNVWNGLNEVMGVKVSGTFIKWYLIKFH